MTTLHAAALQLAQKGLAVFPCQPRGKEPACDAGLHAATCDVERINRWWQAFPDLNIGIATGVASGVFVLDIDGEDGEGSLLRLEGEHGVLPPTVEAITGKGRHCYFRTRRSIHNSVGQIGIGLDIRGDGGYVIAPPSVHPSGRPYAWSVDTTRDFATAPGWLLTIIGTAKGGNGKAGKPFEHWHAVLTQPIHNGERNSTLASICGKLLHAGLTDGFLLYDLIMCVNIARCEQPLSPSEVETIVISVGRTHLKRQRDA
jgi:Bifunctional DNA primase/polymerase, N-terminal/Primase C terminal 1 (PriCT-1)